MGISLCQLLAFFPRGVEIINGKRSYCISCPAQNILQHMGQRRLSRSLPALDADDSGFSWPMPVIQLLQERNKDVTLLERRIDDVFHGRKEMAGVKKDFPLEYDYWPYSLWTFFCIPFRYCCNLIKILSFNALSKESPRTSSSQSTSGIFVTVP